MKRYSFNYTEKIATLVSLSTQLHNFKEEKNVYSLLSYVVIKLYVSVGGGFCQLCNVRIHPLPPKKVSRSYIAQSLGLLYFLLLFISIC